MEDLDTVLRRHTESALQVQDACNLSGVVHSLNDVVSDLWKVARRDGHGTDWVNTHPIVIAYVDKLASLSGASDGLRVLQAYDACSPMSEG